MKEHRLAIGTAIQEVMMDEGVESSYISEAMAYCHVLERIRERVRELTEVSYSMYEITSAVQKGKKK